MSDQQWQPQQPGQPPTWYPPNQGWPSLQQGNTPPYQQFQEPPLQPQPYGQQSYGQPQPMYYGGQPPQNFFPPQHQPKKSRRWIWITLSIILGIGVLGCVFCGVIGSFLPKTPNTVSTPTLTQADYKARTTDTTVINLDKKGNADKGKDVHFTCKILKFVKDSTGNTTGANVTTPDAYSSSVIQVTFTTGTDVTQLNEGDILQVWGTDEGVFSGTNAFGGTVQEVSITAQYMKDQTTNYQANT